MTLLFISPDIQGFLPEDLWFIVSCINIEMCSSMLQQSCFVRKGLITIFASMTFMSGQIFFLLEFCSAFTVKWSTKMWFFFLHGSETLIAIITCESMILSNVLLCYIQGNSLRGIDYAKALITISFISTQLHKRVHQSSKVHKNAKTSVQIVLFSSKTEISFSFFFINCVSLMKEHK